VVSRRPKTGGQRQPPSKPFYKAAVQPRRVVQHEYFWILGMEGGHPVVIGPENSYVSAYQKAMRAFQGAKWAVYRLPTRDRGRAVQMLRNQMVEGGQTLDQALKRFKHYTDAGHPKDKRG